MPWVFRYSISNSQLAKISFLDPIPRKLIRCFATALKTISALAILNRPWTLFILITSSRMFVIRLVLLRLLAGANHRFSPAKKDWTFQRTKYLEGLKAHKLTTDGDTKSIDTVLHAYRDDCSESQLGERGDRLC